MIGELIANLESRGYTVLDKEDLLAKEAEA